MSPGCEGRVCRGRGLSRGSLPVRNTGEMGAGPITSDWVFGGTPGWGSERSREVKDKQQAVVRALCSDAAFALNLYTLSDQVWKYNRGWPQMSTGCVSGWATRLLSWLKYPQISNVQMATYPVLFRVVLWILFVFYKHIENNFFSQLIYNQCGNRSFVAVLHLFSYYTQHVVLSLFCICISWISAEENLVFAVCTNRQRK